MIKYSSFKAYLVFIAVIFSVGSCIDRKEPIDIQSTERIDSFFGTISQGDYIQALDGLLKSNKNIPLNDSAATTVREGFRSINEYSGSFLGYKLLKKRIIKDDISVYSYLVKYEKKFFRFVFIFYQNGPRTEIFKFSYDDDLAVELEESLKLYIE